MTHIDNSNNMTAEDVKQVLINSIQRTVEKTVAGAKYNRTILATIQYCSNASAGQYKIKYQNGYYTAYASDTTRRYANNATVYVTVPDNNLSNRLFITGLATDDNGQITYLTNLEGDQQFITYGKNFINVVKIPENLNMSSHWDMPGGRTISLYDYNGQPTNQSLGLLPIGEIETAIRQSDGFIRFGAEFKTNLTDDRKVSGNYGIQAVLAFKVLNTDGTDSGKEEFKTYTLDTFNMDGTPFEFTEYSARYNYWEIDKANFKRVQSINCFVQGFPESHISPQPLDIGIRNVSLYAALKVYDSISNDVYKVSISTPEGTLFGIDDPSDASRLLKGELRFNGTPVSGASFYWARQNLAVDSVGHHKYLSLFGKGWQCLNNWTKTQTNSTDINDLDSIYSEVDEPGYIGIINWKSMESIRLTKDQCKGRITTIKLIAVYERQAYESNELQLINLGGYYLLLNSSNGTEFYNGNGYTTITAGVFQTEANGVYQGGTSYSPTPKQCSLTNNNISYKWQIVTNDIVQDIPASTPSNFLLNEPDWSTTRTGITGKDDETADDNTVTAYLTALSEAVGVDVNFLTYCLQRYDYYNNYCNSHEQTQSGPWATADRRRKAIMSDWQKYLDHQYVADYSNVYGFKIVGPSDVTAKYVYNSQDMTEEQLYNLYQSSSDPYDYAVIDIITHDYNDGHTTYTSKQQNTLFNLKASDIVNMMTVQVTALIDNDGLIEPLETKQITLVNKEGSGLKYNLEIVNGTQSFVYNAAGKAPTIKQGSSDSTISIKPLSFRFLNADGTILYDSTAENSEEVITLLKPEWRFYSIDSLIKTKYSPDLTLCDYDSEVANRLILKDAAQFYYTIADDYNVDYKERSNIQLIVHYEGSVYVADTNLTFVKQGDLGTNGTSLFLDIDDPVYEQYRSDVLSNDEWSEFTYVPDENSKSTKTYYPNERHLRNTYLYATKTYAKSGDRYDVQDSFDNGDFVNLKFARTGYENGSGIDKGVSVRGDTTIELYGYWNEDGSIEPVDASRTAWTVRAGGTKDIQDQSKIGRTPTYDRASFGMKYATETQGEDAVVKNRSHVTLELTPPIGLERDAGIFYKPLEVVYTEDEKRYNWTASNIVQCASGHKVEDWLDSITKEPIINTCYGYYQIPFYYFAHYTKENNIWVNRSEDLDPARHIVVTGGYDQVVYDADGLNPVYNKQNPFTFYMFDENNKDITQDVLKNSRTSITWNASYGFRVSPIYRGNIPNYEDLNPNTNVMPNDYCLYNSKIYKCKTKHAPGKEVTVKISNTETYVYNQGGKTVNFDFVTPYWEEVPATLREQTCDFTPPPSYDACAYNSLFSSWVSLKVVYYNTANTDKYEAVVLLPINVLCNVYGSDELNGWDGQKTKVEDGYIISSKVAAGYKDDQNRFTGITIGRKMVTNGSSNENQVGLFGYGKYIDENNIGAVGYGQTLFLDAKTGLGVFGPKGSTQIILNPKVPKEGNAPESWSKLGGWYFSPNYLYKPLYADDNYETTQDLLELKPPGDAQNIPGSVGFYVPGSTKAGELTADTVFMWASAANHSSLDFDNDGSLTALGTVIKNIENYFNTHVDLPLAYPVIVNEVEVGPEIQYNFVISNFDEIYNRYYNSLDVPAYIQADLDDYVTNWGYFINSIDTSLKDVVLQAIHDIEVIMNDVNFPTVSRVHGAIELEVNADNLTIANLDEINYWYCNSNDPVVTAQPTLIGNLINAIAAYVQAYQDFIDGSEDPSIVEVLLGITQELDEFFSGQTIPRFVLHKVQTSEWNYSEPYKPLVNSSDKYTITNYTDLNLHYSRAAVSAPQEKQELIAGLKTLLDNYNTLHTKYIDWSNQFDDAACITYDDSNDKKRSASFSVTYGGELHCTKAHIEGEIRANSGFIGNGTKAIQIAKNIINPTTGIAEYYLLYNKDFWVRGDDNMGGSDPAIYMNGRIMAKSGQFGAVGEDKTGADTGTVFIEYNWYPRRLPDNHTIWDDDFLNHPWDIEQGPIVKYALWHRNFSIIDNPNGAYNPDTQGGEDFKYAAGDTAFLGRIYTTGGRLGDWVIDNDFDSEVITTPTGTETIKYMALRDPYQTLILRPNKAGPQASSRKAWGYIQSGKTIIYGDGSIDGACQRDNGPGVPPDQPLWYITKEGVAHFSNNAYSNQFICTGASSVATRNGTRAAGSSVVITPSNITLSAGGSINIGNLTLTNNSGLNVNDSIAASAINLGNGISFNSSGLFYGDTAYIKSTGEFKLLKSHADIDMNDHSISGLRNLSLDVLHASAIHTNQLYLSGGITLGELFRSWLAQNVDMIKYSVNGVTYSCFT